ncbi:hypothetical protein [Streptomyces naphthomycinicus]|uniref:hypothetical protein n=1 Tax=Streptomyces naphthomycinicus TaxID=2872625 RepID=UPI001CEDEF7F|nr:hypothetical protein [Streptomyces sp. TML10]
MRFVDPDDGGFSLSDKVAVFLAAATLVPFLQAVASAVGSDVGARLNRATRSALKQILQRELERESSAGETVQKVLTTPRGTRVCLDTDMPEEALAQLLVMTFETLEPDNSDIPALVRWTSAGWLATVVRVGGLTDRVWDPERAEWVAPHDHRTTPPGRARRRARFGRRLL